MPPQQNLPQQQSPQPQPQMQPQPGMPQQGPNIFAAPPEGSKPPKQKKSKLLIFLVIILSLTTIILATLSAMLYGQMTDYRDNYNTKSAIDIEKAKAEQKQELDANYAEQEKSPNRTYVTPNSSASVKIVYPKTWDLYVQEDNEKGIVDNYFNFNVVPDKSNKDNTYSLRLEVLDKNYADVTKSYDSDVKKGTVKISPYVAKNVKNAETGVRIEGDIRDDIKGSMVILPIRDKTLKLWTESGKYTNDFDKIVLENLTYNP